MTENVWRTKAATQRVQSHQSHGYLEQIVCHLTQGAISTLMIYLFTTVSVWGDYQAGAAAYERGDYETALQELRPLVEDGDPQAQVQPWGGCMQEAMVSPKTTKKRQNYTEKPPKAAML